MLCFNCDSYFEYFVFNCFSFVTSCVVIRCRVFIPYSCRYWFCFISYIIFLFIYLFASLSYLFFIIIIIIIDIVQTQFRPISSRPTISPAIPFLLLQGLRLNGPIGPCRLPCTRGSPIAWNPSFDAQIRHEEGPFLQLACWLPTTAVLSR